MINETQKKDVKLFSKEDLANKMLLKIQKDSKYYHRLIQFLKVAGNFGSQIEVFVSNINCDENQNNIKLWCYDNDDSIFEFYGESQKKADLNIIKIEKNDEVRYYDLSLVKNFEINARNLDYLQTFKEYGFKFGRLITDGRTFYSLFLGENIGFQILIKYTTNNFVDIQALLMFLNSMEKINLMSFVNGFEKLLKINKAEFDKIRIVAYKNMQITGDIELGNEYNQLDNESKNVPNIISGTSISKLKENSQYSSDLKETIEKKTIKPTNSNIVSKKNTVKKQKVEKDSGEKMEEGKIYLDQVGYQKFMQELDDARRNLLDHQKSKGDSFNSSAGDGWHDNFDFEESERRERLLLGILRDKKSQAERIEIIDRLHEHDSELIDINDLVSLTFIFGEDDNETDNYLLSAGSNDGDNNEYTIVSVNSPLGQAIYHKPIGDLVSYSVNGTGFSVKINEKVQKHQLTKKKL